MKDFLIAVKEFCARHNIEDSFIVSLQRRGLLEVVTIDEDLFINTEQLQQLEKIILLHYELDINLEGIETITHLLERINILNKENIKLRNRLRLYESDHY